MTTCHSKYSENAVKRQPTCNSSRNFTHVPDNNRRHAAQLVRSEASSSPDIARRPAAFRHSSTYYFPPSTAERRQVNASTRTPASKQADQLKWQLTWSMLLTWDHSSTCSPAVLREENNHFQLNEHRGGTTRAGRHVASPVVTNINRYLRYILRQGVRSLRISCSYWVMLGMQLFAVH